MNDGMDDGVNKPVRERGKVGGRDWISTRMNE